MKKYEHVPITLLEPFFRDWVPVKWLIGVFGDQVRYEESLGFAEALGQLESEQRVMSIEAASKGESYQDFVERANRLRSYWT